MENTHEGGDALFQKMLRRWPNADFRASHRLRRRRSRSPKFQGVDPAISAPARLDLPVQLVIKQKIYWSGGVGTDILIGTRVEPLYM